MADGGKLADPRQALGGLVGMLVGRKVEWHILLHIVGSVEPLGQPCGGTKARDMLSLALWPIPVG